MTNEELVSNHAGELAEKVVKELIGQDAVEIRFEFEGNDQWSVVSIHIYEEDKEISLRLHSGNRYELYLGYYDGEDEFFELTQLLTAEEKKIVPKGLQKLMEKVLSDEQGMRLPGNLLSK